MRHKLSVILGTLLISLLFLSTIMISLQAIRLAEQRDIATKEAITSQRITDFMVSIFSVSDPIESLGNKLTAREILDRGAEKIDNELEDQPEIQATLMHTIGRVYHSLGITSRAKPLLHNILPVTYLSGIIAPLRTQQNQTYLPTAC